MTVEYKCIDVYKKPENPMEWLPCPRCGLRPLVWEFDNGRSTACGCGTDCYSHWSVQAESRSFNDEMLDFINSVFGHEDMINNSITLENIGYHKIGSIFKYNIGSKEVELKVVESSDASCEGCAFNNSKNYYCKDTHCIDVDRKDDIDVIYKKVKRS